MHQHLIKTKIKAQTSINMPRLTRAVTLVFLALSVFSGCANKAAEILNPFADTPSLELGERNNSALLDETGSNGESGSARHALEVMGAYRSAQAPQPAYPVIRPAEVRLMWVPDHLNKAGDLVPNHYYYLKVMKDRWELEDAFDTEEGLYGGSSGSGSGSGTPWVIKQ